MTIFNIAFVGFVANHGRRAGRQGQLCFVFIEFLGAIFMAMPSMSKMLEMFQKITITAVAGVAGLLGLFTLYDAISSDLVVMEMIQVPDQFTSKGFSESITTQRLLDEISILNSQATLNRKRKQYGDQAFADSISRSEASIGGVDVKFIRSTIQKIIGKQPQNISGEIAVVESAGKKSYTVRIRSTPPRRLLVDIIVDGEPGFVLEQAALAMIEKLDPIISISLYRQKGDLQNALRVANMELMTSEPSDIASVMIQRSFVFSDLGRFREAEEDILRSGEGEKTADRSNQIQQLSASAYMYQRQNNFNKSLIEAEKLIVEAPNNPQGYNFKAVSLRRIGRPDDSISAAQIGLKKSSSTFWPLYQQIGLALHDKKDFEAAVNYFDKALALAPKQGTLYFFRAESLRSLGNKSEYAKSYENAYKYDPVTPAHVIGLLEVAIEFEKSDQIALVTPTLKVLMEKEMIGPNWRARAANALRAAADYQKNKK